MGLYVLSDLHIQGPEDPLYRSLLSVIREKTASGDTLVLAGDLFDLFVGGKPVFVGRYSEFIDALSDAGRRGVRIHYIEGNHDFLLEDAFARIPGLELHPEEVSLEIGGKRFLVAHGDTVDQADYSYRLLRGFFRSPVMRALVEAVPGEWLERIGEVSSRRSRGSKPLLPADLPPERLEKLRATYHRYAAQRVAEGYDYVVMGHCHDLDETSFHVDGKPGQYVNMGYPPVHGTFLAWSPGDEKVSRMRLPGS